MTDEILLNRVISVKNVKIGGKNRNSLNLERRMSIRACLNLVTIIVTLGRQVINNNAYVGSMVTTCEDSRCSSYATTT